MTGNVTENSTAIGMLICIRNDSMYFECRQGQSEVIVELSSGEYNITVFAIEEDGLPFERAVTLTRTVQITEGSMEIDLNVGIIIINFIV